MASTMGHRSTTSSAATAFQVPSAFPQQQDLTRPAHSTHLSSGDGTSRPTHTRSYQSPVSKLEPTAATNLQLPRPGREEGKEMKRKVS